MNDRTDLERVLTDWFAEGPAEMPDRVPVVVADRIGRTVQRRWWRLDQRYPSMSPIVKIAAGIAAVLLIAVVGVRLLSTPSSEVGGPPVSSSPSAAPSVSASPTSPSVAPSASTASFECANGTTGCGGDLSPGVHASSAFAIPFAFVIDGGGWQNWMDVTATYGLSRQGGVEAPIVVMTDVGLLVRADDCGPAPVRRAATTADDIVAYVEAHPALEASAPTPVTIDGHAGASIDFVVSPEWTHICSDADPLNPSVVMTGDTLAEPERLIAYGGLQRVRWTAVDVDGRTLLIEQAGPRSQERFDQSIAADASLIDSLDLSP